MQYTTLPNTSIEVSKICLGSMTWGEQNTEAEGHEQLDFALEKGVNFIDTAELYSVPSRPETQGSSERIIGSWLKKRNLREAVIIASKIIGPMEFAKHIRTVGFTKEAIDEAIHGSLKRLQTDYIDLYQLHWPERRTNFFGQLDYKHNAQEQWEDNFATVLQHLEQHLKAGKIRHIGVSNESPYGMMRFLQETNNGATKISTVQNPYSLLNRKDEIGLSEILLREKVGYLPYSPLGFGQLTGKYLEDPTPPNARVTIFPNYNRYHNKRSFAATRAYNEIAKAHGISLTQLSLAFLHQKDFVTSAIIGATNLQQLAENIDSVAVHLSDEVIQAIDAVHLQNPNPAP